MSWHLSNMRHSSPSAMTAATSNGHTFLRTNGPPPVDPYSDKVMLKHGTTDYTLFFPQYCIDRGELTIGDIRAEAAYRFASVHEPEIEWDLYFGGRRLENDGCLVSEEGLASGADNEIIVVIGHQSAEDGIRGVADNKMLYREGDENGDGGYDSGVSSPLSPIPTMVMQRRQSRHRKSKSKNRAHRIRTSVLVPGTYNNNNNNIGSPTSNNFRPQSSPSSLASPSLASCTPSPRLDLLDSLASKFRSEFVPQCEVFFIHCQQHQFQFRQQQHHHRHHHHHHYDDHHHRRHSSARSSPFRDSTSAAWLKAEHLRLSETILTQVLLVLDGLDVTGDESIRARRKALAAEVQDMLTQLDDAVEEIL